MKNCEHEYLNAEPYGFICKKCGRNQLSNPAMNTVCKEQKTKIMKKSNLDGGTSVGFSKTSVAAGNNSNTYFTVCKEHEWVAAKKDRSIEMSNELVCRKCGKLNPPIDFKIKENLKVISDNDWEDILVEFSKLEYFDKIKSYEMYDAFVDWITENYLAPEKKNP